MSGESIRIRHPHRTSSDTAAGWTFLSPWIIGFVFFSGLPIVFSFLLSLTRWNMLGDPQFVGLENYQNLLSGDSELLRTLQVTFVFTIINVAVTIAMSLLLAVLLNLNVRFTPVFQFFYYVPTIMPSVVMTSAMILIFNSQLGIVNYIMQSLGVTSPPNWTGSSTLVWVVVGVASVYTFATGQAMLVFSAALKDVPGELYEAASLDGANSWNQFWRITIPAISPMLLFNTVVATVNSFNGSFALLFPLTGGGPGDATKVISLLIYEKAFRTFSMGEASALAVVLFIIVAAITAVQFRLSNNSAAE